MIEYKYNIEYVHPNRVFSRPSCRPIVAMEKVGQTNQGSMTVGVQAHYIMLIRPPQTLPLVRIYRKLFIFKYVFSMQGMLTSLCIVYQEKEKFKLFVGTSA